jgi:hypothetical protein
MRCCHMALGGSNEVLPRGTDMLRWPNEVLPRGTLSLFSDSVCVCVFEIPSLHPVVYLSPSCTQMNP